MKRALFVVAGACLFAAIGFLVGSVVTNGYSDRFAQSDDEINQFVGCFVFVWLAFILFGGYMGVTECSAVAYRSKAVRLLNNAHRDVFGPSPIAF